MAYFYGMKTQFFLSGEDCLSGMRLIPAGSVNLIVTSPPYNLGVDYGCYDDNKTKEQYLEWTLAWATEAHRTLADDGSLFLNIGGSASNPMLPHEVMVNQFDLGKSRMDDTTGM